MKLPFVEKYKGYTLNCAPQATHDQGFLAFVIITHGSTPAHVDRAAALDLDGFAQQGEAALAALGAAIRWVDEAVLREAAELQAEDLAIDASSGPTEPARLGVWPQPQPGDTYGYASRATADRRVSARHANVF